MKKFKHAVFIGRFQPFHLGHQDAINYGKKIAEELTVGLRFGDAGGL